MKAEMGPDLDVFSGCFAPDLGRLACCEAAPESRHWLLYVTATLGGTFSRILLTSLLNEVSMAMGGPVCLPDQNIASEPRAPESGFGCIAISTTGIL